MAHSFAAQSRTIIIGGGLGGMAAAVALESAGHRLTLLEARKRLGGRAGSFIDAASGEELDNCQHVLLACCTNLQDFYRRTGVLDQIEWSGCYYFRDGQGRRHDLYGLSALPAPLHLGPSMVGFGLLTLTEKAALARAMMVMATTDLASVSDLSFGAWLDRNKQPASLIKKVYDPVVISGLNEDTRKVSAAYAIQIFKTALLGHRKGFLIGTPACTLSALYDRLPIQDLRTSCRVASLKTRGNRVTHVELVGGELLEADQVVLATGFATAQKWAPGDPRFEHVDKLEYVPILGVHLWFDRQVIEEPHAAFIEPPLQWVFRKDKTGTSVHGVISAARSFVGQDEDMLLGKFEKQVREQLPLAKEAKLVRGRIIIEKRATFAPIPGIDDLRPQQGPVAGSLENLYLAGDYTRTTWPATMEGAVRSGYLAAEAITGQRFLVDDLPTEWPAAMLAL